MHLKKFKGKLKVENCKNAHNIRKLKKLLKYV